MQYKTILIPHDGSKFSDKAVDVAIELAMISKESHVILLHVMPEIPTPLVLERPIHSHRTGEVTTISEYSKELYKDIHSNVFKMLDKRKRKFEELNISVEIRSVVGYPSDVILSEAAKNNVNLIIMGTAGLRGISKIKALGSVARRVSEQAVCPVLLVH